MALDRQIRSGRLKQVVYFSLSSKVYFTSDFDVNIGEELDVDVDVDVDPISSTIIPNIQALVTKNSKLETHRPGTNVLFPRNSSWKACCSHRPCVATHRPAAVRPSFLWARREEVGR